MLVGNTIWFALKTFIGSPMGRAVLLLAAFLAWTGYQRHDAARKATEALTVKIEAKTAEEYQRQLDAAREVADNARKRATESEQRATELEAERDSIIEDLRAAPDGDCPIPDDVRERLRRIGR